MDLIATRATILWAIGHFDSFFSRKQLNYMGTGPRAALLSKQPHQLPGISEDQEQTTLACTDRHGDAPDRR